MKIAIFENEFDTLEVAFKYLNKNYYDNKLEIKVFPRSQNLEKIEDILQYDLVMIDLDLSTHSDLDGFGLIKKIENELGYNRPKMVILTGQDLEENFHEINNLKYLYKVLEKTVNYRKLKNLFDELFD